jgi:Phage integrase family.
MNIQDKAVNLAVRLAAGAGLRKSEILKLSINNLKDNKIEVLGAKGGKDRIVGNIFDKSLIADVKTFLSANNLDKFGDAVSAGKINREISNVISSGSIHRLRHNYAINSVKEFEAMAIRTPKPSILHRLKWDITGMKSSRGFIQND